MKNMEIKKLNASFTADPVGAAVRAGYPLKKKPQKSRDSYVINAINNIHFVS
jgi:hypothetical protein